MTEWWEAVLNILIAVVSWYVGWRSALSITERGLREERTARREDERAAARQRAYEGPYWSIKGSLTRALETEEWFYSAWHPDEQFTRSLNSGGLDDPPHMTLKRDVEKIIDLNRARQKSHEAYYAKFREAYPSLSNATYLNTSGGPAVLSLCHFTPEALVPEVYQGRRDDWCRRHRDNFTSNAAPIGNLATQSLEDEAIAELGRAFDALSADMRPFADAYEAAVGDLKAQAQVVWDGLTQARAKGTYYPGPK